MPRPTRHLTDGEVPADLRHPTSPDFLRSTFAAVGEHTADPAHDTPLSRWLHAPGWSRSCPPATTGSRAVQR